jgi:DNA-binding transcriptional LysR family regulator
MSDASLGYKVELDVFEGPLDLLLHLVKKHELDIFDIPISFITRKYLEYLDLMSDPYLLVVSRDHPLARRKTSPRLEALGKVDLVGYRVCRAHAEVERFLRSRGIETRTVFRAEDNTLLQGLAAQGMGAAIMPLLAIDHTRRDTVALDLAGQIPRRRIGLVWHRDRYRTPAARDFIEIAREAANDSAERRDGVTTVRQGGRRHRSPG